MVIQRYAFNGQASQGIPECCSTIQFTIIERNDRKLPAFKTILNHTCKQRTGTNLDEQPNTIVVHLFNRFLKTHRVRQLPRQCFSDLAQLVAVRCCRRIRINRYPGFADFDIRKKLVERFGTGADDICVKCGGHSESSKCCTDFAEFLFCLLNFRRFTRNNHLTRAVNVGDNNLAVPLVQVSLDFIPTRPDCSHRSGDGGCLFHEFAAATRNSQKTLLGCQGTRSVECSHLTITVPRNCIGFDFKCLQQIKQ